LVSRSYSDDEDDNNDEEATRRERSQMLTHFDARVSRIDLTEPDEDDEYEVVHHDDVRRDDMGPHSASDSNGHEGGNLSSKAGIILVGLFFFIF
jgi:hypothetical protein